MMRRLLFAVVLVVAPSILGQDAPPRPPVPQAVKALEHLKPKPSSGPTSWTNGPYQYDGAGNISAIGAEAYVYDKVGRLKNATLRGPDLSSMQTQSFDYDVYGNLTGTSKLGQTVNLPTSVLTNRLNGLVYDASGNVTTSGVQTYSYDAVGMLNTVHVGNAAQPRIIYAYTADDERLFAFDVSTSTTHWTLRGFDNKILRDFKQVGSNWSVDRDYIYRDGLLLAALKSSGAVEHYTLDHLGTPRLITDGSGRKIGYHVYWPYGEEWTAGGAQEGNPLKFTGHERDADSTGGSAPLDYMHARYYGAGWGRFLAADPALNADSIQATPQRWNRYLYASGNPLRYTDPDGRNPIAEIVAHLVAHVVLHVMAEQTMTAVEGGVPSSVAELSYARAGGLAYSKPEAGRFDGSATISDPSPTARGRSSEARVLESMGMAKNTQKVTTKQGGSIPDGMDSTNVVEVKDTKNVSNTRQLQIQRENAQATGRNHVVVTGTNTHVTQPVQTGSTVIRRDDLGPAPEPEHKP